MNQLAIYARSAKILNLVIQIAVKSYISRMIADSFSFEHDLSVLFKFIQVEFTLLHCIIIKYGYKLPTFFFQNIFVPLIFLSDSYKHFPDLLLEILQQRSYQVQGSSHLTHVILQIILS